jgi:CDP-diacylglycerol--glycerol-3-phosphate 3-phosphatidyltransferase
MQGVNELTLASWITCFRFLVTPFIYWQLVSGSNPEGIIIAVVLLFLAAVSDGLDGWAARSRNEISELGKTLDPLADKTVIIVTLLALVVGWNFPVWLFVAYLLKELLQLLAGLFLLRKYQQLISANMWGKSATVGFFLGFGAVLLQPWLGLPVWLGIVMIGASVFLSFCAFYTYYLAFRKLQ